MTTSITTSTTITIHPTERAQRLNLSHRATTHRAPLTSRLGGASHRRAPALTPMARYPLSVEPSHQQFQTHES